MNELRNKKTATAIVWTVLIFFSAISLAEHAGKKDPSPVGPPKAGAPSPKFPMHGQVSDRCRLFNQDPNQQLAETEWLKSWDGAAFDPPSEGDQTGAGFRGMKSFGFIVQQPLKTGPICKKNPIECRPRYIGGAGSVLVNRFAKKTKGPTGPGPGCAILTAAHLVMENMVPPLKPVPGPPLVIGGDPNRVKPTPPPAPAKPSPWPPKVKLRSVQFDPQHKREMDAEFTVLIPDEFWNKPSNSDLDTAILIGDEKACAGGLADAEPLPPCDDQEKLSGVLLFDALRNGGPRVVVPAKEVCLEDELRVTAGNLPKENPRLSGPSRLGPGARPGAIGGQGPGDSGALLRLVRRPQKHSFDGSGEQCAMGNLYGGPGGLFLGPHMGFSTPLKWMNKTLSDVGLRVTAPRKQAARYAGEELLPAHRAGSLTH